MKALEACFRENDWCSESFRVNLHLQIKEPKSQYCMELDHVPETLMEFSFPYDIEEEII